MITSTHYSTFLQVLKTKETAQGMSDFDNLANDTDQINFIEELETFLYTPYGLGALAGVSVLVTSLFWLLVCCSCCCCYWRKLRNSEEGMVEADKDLHFIDSSKAPGRNGTMSSGYNTGQMSSYSMTSLLASNSSKYDSSMESVVGHVES